MKTTKKTVALLLVVVFIAMIFSACGNSEVVTDDASDQPVDTENETDEEVVEEITEITMMILSLSAQGEGAEEVEEAINEITEKEINVHVNLMYVEVGNFAQQLNLAIAGDETVDLCHITPIAAVSFSSLTSQQALQPITDLMEEYAPETLELLGDLIKGTSVNGEIYGVGNYRDLSTGGYILMRKDMLEGAGMMDAFEEMSTWTEYEEIMEAVTAEYDISGIASNGGDGTLITIQGYMVDDEDFDDAWSYDALGDTYKVIATDDDGNVYSYFESEEYVTMLERVRGWYEDGLVYQDSATNEEHIDSLFLKDVTFSGFANGELGFEATHTAATGYEMVAKKVVSALINTAGIVKFGWGVPVCAEEPEAAVKFLNLMYTNAEINNLLTWGIEGKDYVVEDGVAKYPEGVTSETAEYHTSDFLYGNQFLTTPWEGSPDNVRETALAEMIPENYSQYLGFSCDTTSIANELTAISNVITEYQPGLETGTLPLTEYDNFISKLKDAGIDKVVEEYQTQLDAWMATQ